MLFKGMIHEEFYYNEVTHLGLNNFLLYVQIAIKRDLVLKTVGSIEQGLFFKR